LCHFFLSHEWEATTAIIVVFLLLHNSLHQPTRRQRCFTSYIFFNFTIIT